MALVPGVTSAPSSLKRDVLASLPRSKVGILTSLAPDLGEALSNSLSDLESLLDEGGPSSSFFFRPQPNQCLSCPMGVENGWGVFRHCWARPVR